MPPPEFRGASQAGLRGDMVMVVDHVVGQVLATLDELGVADDTLIICTSDNGARPCDVDGETYGHKSCGDWRGFKADMGGQPIYDLLKEIDLENLSSDLRIRLEKETLQARRV